MSSRLRRGVSSIWLIVFIVILSVYASYAESVNYVYDDLNRLVRVEYGSGKVIEYSYDEVGNRLQMGDISAPATTATPSGGIYNSPQSVTLSCTDVKGSGCDKIYYTTDGSTPTTSSTIYSTPITISSTATLKFFARDLGANSEPIKSQTYTIDLLPPTGTMTINAGATSTNNTSVTLTLSCTDANSCPQMKFSNDNIAYSTPETFATTKTWTLTSGDGSKSVYVQFKDNAGNWSVSYSKSILLDTTIPTTVATPAGGLYNAAKSVALSCSDGTGSGCNKIYYTTNGSTPTSASTAYSVPLSIAATATLKFFAKDKAGNSEPVKSESYTIDTILPTGSLAINGGALSTNNPVVALTLTCTDANGCSQMMFSHNNSTYTALEPFASSKTWNLTSGDGSKTVYVKFKDNAGNSSAAYYKTVKLDTTIPTTTASPVGGIYNAAKTVTLTCADGTGAGCDKIYYTVDGSMPTVTSSVYSSALSISATTTLKYFAADKAGNSEAPKTQIYTIDKTAPSGTIAINSGAISTNSTLTTLTLSCTDSSGCSHMQFSNDNVTYSAAEAYAATKAWTLISGSGTRTVYAKFRDLAGNWSTPYIDQILLDITAPATSASPIGGTYAAPQTITLTCNDGTGSGCDKIYYTTDGSTPTISSNAYSSAISIAATAILKYFARDLAGNSETIKSQTYTIK